MSRKTKRTLKRYGSVNRKVGEAKEARKFKRKENNQNPYRKYGGGSITRYIDYLIEHRNTRAVEHALFHANDELKANKSAEEQKTAMYQF